MALVDLANEIFIELEEPSDLTIPSISFYLQTNIGKLNGLLDISVVIVDGDFSPALNSEEQVIYKQLFEVYYYGKLLKKSLGASAYDTNSIIEVKEGNRTVKKMNKNEVAKTLRQVKKDAEETLLMLVGVYRHNRSDPSQVIVWDDRMEDGGTGYPWRGYRTLD